MENSFMETFSFALRDYQKRAIADTYKLIRQSEKKILLFAPTGGGKTIIATKIVYDAVSRHKRVLFVVHRDILVGQTYNKFVSVGLKCGFFKAGWNEDLEALVQIASVQTLPNRNEWKTLNYDVIIFDECHLVAFSKVCLQMTKKIFPHAIYIGLTATPWRLSKRESLGDIYSALVCTPMPKELIEAGFLVKPSYYGLDFDVDLDQVELSGGDYNPAQLSHVCDRPELINQLCTNWFELGYQRATIAFAVGINHAENIAKAFNERSVKAAIVTGKTPISTRNVLYQKLASGELKVLASCSALSEGFDVPKVSCVILARPTKSKALYFQQLGRGLRLAEGKQDCLVLDQSKNVMQHGFIEDLEEVELLKSEEFEEKKPGKPPLKICPREAGGCGSYIHSTYLSCPHCNYSFDLQKLITIIGRNQLLSAEDKEKLIFYRKKLRLGYQKNYAPTWAALNFKEKYGFLPPFDWGRGAIFGHEKDSCEIYRQYLYQIAERLNKDQAWIERYLHLEFGTLKLP
jgi:superfamily II DNA or RNA helicase